MKNFLLLLKTWWLKFAEALGWVNTRVLLTLTYCILIAPAAIVLTVLRKDLLKRRLTGESSYWVTKEPVQHTLEHVKHQF